MFCRPEELWAYEVSGYTVICLSAKQSSTELVLHRHKAMAKSVILFPICTLFFFLFTGKYDYCCIFCVTMKLKYQITKLSSFIYLHIKSFPNTCYSTVTSDQPNHTARLKPELIIISCQDKKKDSLWHPHLYSAYLVYHERETIDRAITIFLKYTGKPACNGNARNRVFSLQADCI